MEQQSARLRNTGFLTFFFSGICAISAGVVVSLLQERYGFAYGMTGTLLSLMSVGNLLAGLLIGMLPSVLGMSQCAAAHHRLCGGLRHHGPDGCRGGAGAGVFSGGHCQGAAS